MSSKWQPSDTDKQWLQDLISRLKVGGIWAAPMGFTYQKTEENKLELQSINCTQEELSNVLETIRRVKSVAKGIGIKVVEQPDVIMIDATKPYKKGIENDRK